MIINKIIGYVLLAIGLAMIIFALYQSYNIFTNKTSAPVIFKVSSSQNNSQSTAISNLQTQIQNVVDQQISQTLSPEILPKIFNLVAWSFFAFILVFAGGTIASIGIKLIKII